MSAKGKNEDSQTRLKKALMKKALGYDTCEVVEEYVSEEGEIRLSKKKVTKKNVPPDMTAIKMLIEEEVPIESMTDDELEREKNRLLAILKQSKEGEK